MTVQYRRLLLAGALYLLALAGCSDSEPVFHQAENPLRLSDWNLFALSAEQLVPAQATMVFRPSNQLFTDYAHKLRTLWMPTDSQAQLRDGEIEYPVGTVISKTFYYPSDSDGSFIKQTDPGATTVTLAQNTLIETRLLVRRTAGWDAFPYVWNEEQTEAFLRVAGTSRAIDLRSDGSDLEFVYFVPNENQCAGCHVTSHPDGDMHPLGAIAAQLTSTIADSDGELRLQTDMLQARGWLNETPLQAESESWLNLAAATEDRALAYLNIHCGHCHNPEGAADTSALLLDGSHDLLVNMGVCKPPVAAGGGAGDLQYSIVPGAPQQSILLYRMRSMEPDEMMPELGRSLVHTEGVELISRWIAEMPGSC